MKNYPHLYPNPLKKLVSKPNKTPNKSTSTIQPNASKASLRTLGLYNSTLNRQKKDINRTLTRSIQQAHYRPEGGEQMNKLYYSTEDESLFEQSSTKIGKIKQSFPSKNIDLELNDVLNLIRQQKSKISQRLKALKQSNDYYKKICESYLENRLDCAVNTEDIIDCKCEMVCVDKAIQCRIGQQIKIVEQQPQTSSQDNSRNLANHQAYCKLSKMLQQMNINPAQILPIEQKIHQQILISDYKNLSDKEIIKIQKFFIKKLIIKMPK